MSVSSATIRFLLTLSLHEISFSFPDILLLPFPWMNFSVFSPFVTCPSTFFHILSHNTVMAGKEKRKEAHTSYSNGGNGSSAHNSHAKRPEDGSETESVHKKSEDSSSSRRNASSGLYIVSPFFPHRHLSSPSWHFLFESFTQTFVLTWFPLSSCVLDVTTFSLSLLVISSIACRSISKISWWHNLPLFNFHPFHHHWWRWWCKWRNTWFPSEYILVEFRTYIFVRRTIRQ